MSGTIDIKEFPIDQIQDDSKIVVIGKPGSGKSALIKALVNHLKMKYPVAKVMSGSEEANPFYSHFIPNLFISNKYDEDEVFRFMSRQKKARNDPKCSNPRALLVVDDCADDPKLLSRPAMQKVFKNGRHYKMMFLMGLQYSMDIRPNIRLLIDYIFIFRDVTETGRKNLYANFATIVGSYNNFCDLMDQLTGDYNCLVIDNRQQGMELDRCIYYYKAPFLPPSFQMNFGCDEYRQWSEARYNTAYQPGEDDD